jgi:hypothetical protein
MTPFPARPSLNLNRHYALLFVAMTAVLLFGAAARSGPDTPHRLPATLSADTMTVEVEAGQPLIMDLPSRYGGRPIQAYRIARAPALASVAGESLLWITRRGDEGQHDIALLAQTADAPADTVWVQVNVSSTE